jgi:hypothetical protein
VNGSDRYQQFLAWLWMMHLTLDLELHLAFQYDHDFVGGVREVLPPLAWRVDP